MSSLLDTLLLGLATWRLTSMLVNEEGPLGMLAWMRSKIGVRLTETGLPYGTNVLAEMFTCVWCTSVWVALLWAILYYYGLGFWVGLPFALSALAIIIEGYLDDETGGGSH